MHTLYNHNDPVILFHDNTLQRPVATALYIRPADLHGYSLISIGAERADSNLPCYDCTVPNDRLSKDDTECVVNSDGSLLPWNPQMPTHEAEAFLDDFKAFITALVLCTPMHGTPARGFVEWLQFHGIEAFAVSLGMHGAVLHLRPSEKSANGIPWLAISQVREPKLFHRTMEHNADAHATTYQAVPRYRCALYECDLETECLATGGGASFIGDWVPTLEEALIQVYVKTVVTNTLTEFIATNKRRQVEEDAVPARASGARAVRRQPPTSGKRIRKADKPTKGKNRAKQVFPSLPGSNFKFNLALANEQFLLAVREYRMVSGESMGKSRSMVYYMLENEITEFTIDASGAHESSWQHLKIITPVADAPKDEPDHGTVKGAKFNFDHSFANAHTNLAVAEYRKITGATLKDARSEVTNMVKHKIPAMTVDASAKFRDAWNTYACFTPA